MVWRVKTTKDKPKLKRVSFADPIATELKAPRPTLHDDSIMLIKVMKASKETMKGDTNNITTGSDNSPTSEQRNICSPVVDVVRTGTPLIAHSSPAEDGVNKDTA
jgi:hypothetical protein